MPALTETLIRRAKPRARKYEIPCSRVRGLRLRVLPSGKKVFVVRLSQGGKERRQRIGLVGQVTLAAAQRRAKQLADGGPARAPARAPPANAVPDTIRFEQLVELYRERHVETGAIKESTRINYRHSLKVLAATFGRLRLTEIRFAHVEAFHRALSHQKVAANAHVRLLNHMFTKAAQWELYPWGARLPTAGLSYFREQGRERFLSPAERRRLARALEEAASKKINQRGAVRWSHIAAIQLLCLTGCRACEILDLEWSWIDARVGVIRFPDTKTGKSNRPISDDVLDYLAELEDRHRLPGVPYVVYGRNHQRIHRSSLGEAWRRIRRRAGLDDVRIHDLRHSAASDALNAGVPLEVVSAILGHRSFRTTQRYAHLANSVAREGTAKMTRAILRGSSARLAPAGGELGETLHRSARRPQRRAWPSARDVDELAPALARLTTREREVAALIAKGWRNREIAERLSIAPSTVKDHVHRILKKSGLKSRAEVAAAWPGG